MKNILKKLIPRFIFDWYHTAMPLLGAVVYFFPSRKLKVIGVTGTNGKTTTVNMISNILEEAGHKNAFLSSIKFQIAGKEHPNMLKMTMPGRMVVQNFLRKAVKEKCDYAILEVSSEGIKQFRHLFIKFDTAVITNLSPEHIESHKGFENYKKAKGKLFQATKNTHIINVDDENSNYFLEFLSEKKYIYKIKNHSTHKEVKFILPTTGKNIKFLEAENLRVKSDGINFECQEVLFELNLLGSFNIYNALAAISVGLSYGVDLETSAKALKKIKTIPGRMEEIISQPFRVIVDYAVTPDALKKLYETLKEIFSPKKMIAVLGSCGGGRDKWKRPLLGEIAGKYCDNIIVTNEDPYDEDPMEIINSVARGAKGKAMAILDRREAIRKALATAGENDLIVITGKGCEPWMCVAGGKKIAWDDRQVVKEEFQKIN